MEVGLTLVVMVFQPFSLRLEVFLSFKYRETKKEKNTTDSFCVLIHKSNREVIVPSFNKFLSYELDPR